jgi:rhodanese-related sulfurtransferase
MSYSWRKIENNTLFSYKKSMLTLTPAELSTLLDTSPESIDLIDVRWAGEYAEIHLPEARLISLPVLPLKMSEIDKSKQVIFICRSGGRSGQACSLAEKYGIRAYNLSGGMNDFGSEFPTRVVRG